MTEAQVQEKDIRLKLQERMLECPETDEEMVVSTLHKLYEERKKPVPNVPVLFVDSPAGAIALAAKIYRQSMNKVEDGFMLRLKLPKQDPIVVKSGVRYPTFLKWDFAAAIFRANSYIKADAWGYGRMMALSAEAMADEYRLVTQDTLRLVQVQLERWRRYSEAGDHAKVFKENSGYWPIARNAAFGRRRRFPGCLVHRMMLRPRSESGYSSGVPLADKLAREAFLVYPYDEFAIVVRFPEAIHVDEEARLGRMGGPAIEWRDGTGTYAINGRMIPKVTATGKLTFKKILAQNNAEVKRVLISHFGEENFLKELGAEEVARDDYGILYHGERLPGEREIFAMVAVVNSTPEPDGSYKNYYLRVSPQAATPHAAIAQSFRMGTDESARIDDWRLASLSHGNWAYNPSVET